MIDRLFKFTLVVLIAAVLTGWLYTPAEATEPAELGYVVRTNQFGVYTHCWRTNVQTAVRDNGALTFSVQGEFVIVADQWMVATDAALLGVDSSRCQNGRYGIR